MKGSAEHQRQTKTRDRDNRLGETIYMAREVKGVSSRALAARVGIHHSYMNRIQLGEYKQVAPDILVGIARELDLKVADLYALAGYSSPTELPDLEGFLSTKYRSLPSEDVHALRSHLDYLVEKNATHDSDRLTSQEETTN